MDDINDSELYTRLIKVSKYLSGYPGYVLRFDTPPTIRKTDIDNGSVMRYFGRKTNEPNGEIVEIDETLYNKLKNSNFYVTVSLSWRIAGKIEDRYVGTVRIYTGVVSSNILATLDADKILKGVISKLPDPLQYYQKE